MTIAWVIGGGGLLGSALRKTLRRKGIALFEPTIRLNWSNPDIRNSQLTCLVTNFAAHVTAAKSWEIYWAAGIGAMNSSEETLSPETHALTTLLQLITHEPRLIKIGGAIAFASSAGALYAGSRDVIISEATNIAPTTAYGREKLKQENLLEAFTIANRKMTTLIARISTIYGAGQASNKQQGLLTHIARSILKKKPIQIYVPYDTIRDYIFVEDAANLIINALSLTQKRSGFFAKIIAAEKPTTIAEIISVFEKISRRKLLVYTSANKLSDLYARRVQFRSISLIGEIMPPTTSLTIGIANLMKSELLNYTNSINSVNKLT